MRIAGLNVENPFDRVRICNDPTSSATIHAASDQHLVRADMDL